MKQLENLIGNQSGDFDSKKYPRLPRYERLESIRQAIASGLSSKEEIAEKIGLSPNAVYHYARGAGIRLPNKSRYGRRLEHTEEIKKAFDEGLSLQLTAKKVGLHPGTVYMYARSSGIALPGKSRIKSEEEYIGTIKNAIEEGCNSINGLAKKLGYAQSTVKKYAAKAGIQLPFRGYRKRRGYIDELISKGLSLNEIGKIIGISRQAVDQYVTNSGQHDTWKKNRFGVKEEDSNALEMQQKQRLELLCILDSRITQLAENEDWPCQMALSYIRNAKNNTHISFDTLAEVFKRYENAKKNNEKLSLMELAEGLNISNTHVGKILNKSGLEPLYWKVQDKKILSSKERKAIKKAMKIRIPITDIAYFMNMPYNILQQRFLKSDEKRPDIKMEIIRFGFGSFGCSLTYRMASQIYEAQDCDFKPKEIQELLGTKPEIVDYAIGHRKLIEKTIVRALRVLQDDPMINKPYHSKLENR